MDWYETMKRDHEQRFGELDDSGGIVIGQTPLVGKALWTVLAVVGLFVFIHSWQILGGEVSWLGYRTKDVREKAEWEKSFYSSLARDWGESIQMPMFALKGQEIVIQYKLDGDAPSKPLPRSRVSVSCSCPSTHWGYFRISSPSEGELVMPVTHSWFYRVRIRQSTGPDLSRSRGKYWIGIRSARPKDPKAQYSMKYRR